MSDSVKKTPAGKTKRENAENGFVATEELRDALQSVLVNLIDLQLVGKQAHWNIVGPNFRDLHLNLDEVVDIARKGSDEIAERMRALHATPDAGGHRIEVHRAGAAHERRDSDHQGRGPDGRRRADHGGSHAPGA
nr:ferritin-like domain-containing protein [Arthrobacter sp. JCM 19049]